jgi:hypothetical protein
MVERNVDTKLGEKKDREQKNNWFERNIRLVRFKFKNLQKDYRVSKKRRTIEEN